MSAAGALWRLAWPYLVCLALGFGGAWSWQGARADARVATLEKAEAMKRADLEESLRVETERKQRLADTIDQDRAAANRQFAKLRREKQDAIHNATTGRYCLGDAALRVLDDAPAGLKPPAGLPHPGPLSGAAAGPATHPAQQGADAGSEYASDRNVADWIVIARDRYERCRGRIDDIRRLDGGR